MWAINLRSALTLSYNFALGISLFCMSNGNAVAVAGLNNANNASGGIAAVNMCVVCLSCVERIREYDFNCGALKFVPLTCDVSAKQFSGSTLGGGNNAFLWQRVGNKTEA